MALRDNHSMWSASMMAMRSSGKKALPYSEAPVTIRSPKSNPCKDREVLINVIRFGHIN